MDRRLLTKDERSAWIDQAAKMAMQALLPVAQEKGWSLKTVAEVAYASAEALWAERNSR
jgi:hypothetical protein